MSKFYIPANNPEDWKQLLAEPDKQWKTGYSAKSLAYCWHCNNDFLHLVFGGVPTQSPPATKNFATFEGQFTSNRGGSKLLRVTITDVDEPGTGNDTIDVRQWNHSIQDFEPWFGTGEEEGIDGGNFQVHDLPYDDL